MLMCDYCGEACDIIRQDNSGDDGEWVDFVSDCCFDSIQQVCEDLDNDEVVNFELSQHELQAIWEASRDQHAQDNA